MTLRAFAALFLFGCCPGWASSPLEASLRDLACGADHVFVGRVVAVDMIDAHGRSVQDEKAKTGPGLEYTIRLKVEVLEILESAESVVPPSIWIPLDSFMHFSLGQIRAAHTEPSEPMLVFLRGEQYEPIIAGRFLWEIEARAEALELRRLCNIRRDGLRK